MLISLQEDKEDENTTPALWIKIETSEEDAQEAFDMGMLYQELSDKIPGLEKDWEYGAKNVTLFIRVDK